MAAIGNEDALFGIIKKYIGQSRLFPVGIGSAPNSHFMNRAARFGRGTFTYIGKITEVETRMQGLINKLENPVMTNIRLHFESSNQADMPETYPGQSARSLSR